MTAPKKIYINKLCRTDDGGYFASENKSPMSHEYRLVTDEQDKLERLRDEVEAKDGDTFPESEGEFHSTDDILKIIDRIAKGDE